MRRLIALAIGIAAVALTAAGQSAPFTITTTSLPAATFGQPYTPVILQTANSAGPMAWSFVPAGSGPTGFVVGSALTGQLDTTGTFCYGFNTQSGPPLCTGNVQAAPGVYNFTLQVTSLSTNQSTTQQFSLAVVLPLQITTSSLPNAAANLAYSVQLQSSGGTGQFSWSIAGGGLPPGIGLDPELGLLSGTAPNATASYTFTVRLQDLATQVTVFRQFTISVVGGLAITTTSLPNAIVNQPYSFQLAAVGATTQVWSVQPGSALPPGFSLSSGGLLTGFGLGTGTFTFGIQVTNPQAAAAITASQIFTFYITLGLLHIVETTIPNATQNVPYRATLTPSGGIPPYRFSFDIPNPQNLSITSNTGVITGTPPNPGGFALPVSLRDATGTVFSQTYTLSVGAAVSITATSLSNGSPGVPYQDTVTVTGGSIPYRWDLIAGSLPPGLTLNSTNGQISGTPTTQGSSQFTIQVTDFGGGIATKVFTIAIGASQVLTITTISLPDGTLNQSYSQTLAASGGTSPYAWSVATGTLPTGLQLNGSTGVISGTAASVGNFTFDILVTDIRQGVARKTLSINVTNPASPVVVTSGNFTGDVLVAFSQTLTATGGTPPYTWSIAFGTLPGGLQLNSTTGVISGTPSPGGTSQVTFTATDARGLTGSKTITITINAPPTPAVSISLGTTTQPAVSLSTSASYPLEITGFLTLTFASSVGSTDGGEARFSDGTRKVFFVVRPNTTQGLFTTVSNGTPAILPGTVAGAITLTASMSAGGQDITPTPAPTQKITIDPGVPVITSVTLGQTSGGLSVVVKGVSNTREVSSGSFTFTVSSGNTLSQSQFTVALTSAYATWFSSAASNPTGGQFQLTVPFSVTGSATAVTKVTVTLTNAKGTSAAASSP